MNEFTATSPDISPEIMERIDKELYNDAYEANLKYFNDVVAAIERIRCSSAEGNAFEILQSVKDQQLSTTFLDPDTNICIDLLARTVSMVEEE